MVIWLGPADNDSGLEVDHVEVLAQEYSQKSVEGLLARDLLALIASMSQFAMAFLMASIQSPQMIAAAILWLVVRHFGHYTVYAFQGGITLACLGVLRKPYSVHTWPMPKQTTLLFLW